MGYERFHPFLKIFLVLSPFLLDSDPYWVCLDPDPYQNDTDPPQCYLEQNKHFGFATISIVEEPATKQPDDKVTF